MNILKYSRARWSPPNGCKLWLPFRDMPTGTTKSRDSYQRTLTLAGTGGGVSAHSDGKGWTFDGVDDSVLANDNATGAGDCTVMAWTFATTLHGPGATLYTRVFDNTGGANGLFFGLVENNGSGNLNTVAAGNYTASVTTVVFALNSIITINKWFHLALTRLASGPTLTIYVNANPVGQGNTSANAAPATGACIGNTTLNTRAFTGTHDDVSVYNRVLYPNEIRNHYNMTKGLH